LVAAQFFSSNFSIFVPPFCLGAGVVPPPPPLSSPPLHARALSAMYLFVAHAVLLQHSTPLLQRRGTCCSTARRVATQGYMLQHSTPCCNAGVNVAAQHAVLQRRGGCCTAAGRVASTTGAVAHAVRRQERVQINAVGPAAVNQARKPNPARSESTPARSESTPTCSDEPNPTRCESVGSHL
jgi:hypothetical protein